MNSDHARQDRLPLLDGLRGIAAISVMLHHIHNVFDPVKATPWFETGYLAVDLFFLLSGFVLTLAAEPRLRQGLSARGFMQARVRRLWPMIALGTAIGAAVHFYRADGTPSAIYIALGLLMIPAIWRKGDIYPMNAPQWSLLWELLANLAHAVIFVRLRQRELAAIVVVSGIALFGSILWQDSNTFGPNSDTWWLGAARVTFSYCAGILIARDWRQRAIRPFLPWWLPLGLPFAIILALPFLDAATALADALVVTVAFPLLFWMAVHASPAPAGIQTWLQRLGAISFPLYGIHMPLLWFCAGIENSVASALAAIAVSLVLAAAIAWIGSNLRLPRPRSRGAAVPLQSA